MLVDGIVAVRDAWVIVVAFSETETDTDAEFEFEGGPVGTITTLLVDTATVLGSSGVRRATGS